jgi:hypothetical protein
MRGFIMTALRMAIAAGVAIAASASAVAQKGPAATACKCDIALHCARKRYQNREVRNCLEANKSKVFDACKIGLRSTGLGKGIGGMGGQGKWLWGRIAHTP